MRTTVLLAGAVAMLALVLSGCSPHPVEPGVSSLPAAVSAEPVDSPAASPTEAAEQWMIHYRARHWQDGSAAAWVDRVRPYVTDAQHARDEQVRDGTAGTDWSEFVNDRCHSTVADVAAVVPPEAPGTPDAVNVLVSATVHTRCTGGASVEHAAATLVVVRAPDGSFRVDDRVF
ncbi:hypothetical protein [Amycolatopsis thermoflava]|uniref:hypothetical protein n=1 Tax=Amycolatopsis thermoflava TaxID=84480 RepID=UPI00382B2E00